MFERRNPAEDVFSAAWQQVREGHSVEAVLAAYPEQAAELEPLLRTALAVRAGLPAPPLSPAALARIQARTQQAAQTRRRPIGVAPLRSADGWGPPPRAGGAGPCPSSSRRPRAWPPWRWSWLSSPWSGP